MIDLGRFQFKRILNIKKSFLSFSIDDEDLEGDEDLEDDEDLEGDKEFEDNEEMEDDEELYKNFWNVNLLFRNKDMH
jgi:hypothetical protein